MDASKVLLSVALVFGLTACGTTEPIIKVETQIVKVPVPVQCIVAVPAEPEYEFDKLTIENDLYDKTRALLSDRKLSLAYEIELLAALNSCIK